MAGLLQRWGYDTCFVLRRTKSNCCSALKRIFTCCVWCCTTCNCCFVTQLIWIILLGGARCCQGGGNVRANSATPVLFNIARITFIFCSEILQEYFPLLVLWYCKNIFYLIICSVLEILQESPIPMQVQFFWWNATINYWTNWFGRLFRKMVCQQLT